MRLLLAASLTLLALVFSGTAQARIAGPATVTDGDSLTVSGQRVHLHGIDVSHDD